MLDTAYRHMLYLSRLKKHVLDFSMVPQSEFQKSVCCIIIRYGSIKPNGGKKHERYFNEAVT